jgi:DNA ligase-1
MVFEEFAEYLEKLEGTGSRLEMTRILAELFLRVTPREARIIAYMSQGKLGPAYRSPDFGVADKLMLRALSIIGGEKTSEIFQKEGDLGKTAERVTGNGEGKLLLEEVYGRLTNIAQAGGSGSVEVKQQLIGELVGDLGKKGAKFAVKMVLGKLRTGFSDMTVLDSLSWMISGDKKLRPEVEKIYNVRADLGEVAEIVKSNNAEGLKGISIGPKLGTPVLAARAERAKSADEIWERNGKCAVEHKLDGLRIQAHVSFKSEILLFSRGLENVTKMYPDIVEGLRKQVKTECVLDGEMIATGKNGKYLPFQETVQRKRKYDISEMLKKVPLKYFVFDVLWADGENLMGKTGEERREKLEKLIKPGETINFMPRILVESVGGIEKYFRQALAAGTEGIVAKRLDAIYQSGSRNFNWIKYKKSYDKSALSDTIDAVVMGYDFGQGKRASFGIGDFLIGLYDEASGNFKTVAKIGTGLTDEEWRTMKTKCDSLSRKEKPVEYEVSKMMECEVWVAPKMVVEIMADEITKSPMHTCGFALRFPRLISWREKSPEEATSVTEIKRMFNLQKK